MEQIILNVAGIKCSVCETSIREKLEQLAGVETVVADSNSNTVNITFDPAQTSIDQLTQVIVDDGLEIVNES